MRGMVLTRSSRSFVALVTAILLLLCQTAFAAQACAQTVTPVQPVGIAAPCHESPSDNAGKRIPVSTSCEAANALPDSAKMPVLAVTELPTILVAYEPAAVSGTPWHGAQRVEAVCHSPPLSILHCRLLN
jgi:hypothetical protein